MESKPVAIFGRVGFICSMIAGETRLRESCYNLVDGAYRYEIGHYYFTKGTMGRTIVSTGNILPNVTKRALKLSEIPASSSTSNRPETILHTALEDVEWLCIPHIHNDKSLFNIKEVHLPILESTSLTSVKLYLVRGSLTCNDKKFIGPCQINIVNKAETVALEECFCLEVYKDDPLLP